MGNNDKEGSAKRNTLTDEIYETLKDDIVTLRLKPGEKLSEVTLAERFNVSRSPIRNALAKLEQNKWVVIKPQIGTIVSLLSEKKAMDILEVRMLLEPFAAATAAERINGEDLELIKQAFSVLRKTPEGSGEYKSKYFETDYILHNTLWKWSGNEEIQTILENYRSEIHRIQVANSELAHRMMETAHEIWHIYDALIARDKKKIQDAMYHHVENIKKAWTSL